MTGSVLASLLSGNTRLHMVIHAVGYLHMDVESFPTDRKIFPALNKTVLPACRNRTNCKTPSRSVMQCNALIQSIPHFSLRDFGTTVSRSCLRYGCRITFCAAITVVLHFVASRSR